MSNKMNEYENEICFRFGKDSDAYLEWCDFMVNNENATDAEIENAYRECVSDGNFGWMLGM